MAFFLLLLLGLASFRLTRVITRDKLPLIDLPREAFVRRWGAWEDSMRVTDEIKRNRIVRAWRYLFASEWESIGSKPEHLLRTNLIMKSLAYLWECDWCTGIWVSGALVAVTAHYVSIPLPFLQWLAVAALTGLLAERDSK